MKYRIITDGMRFKVQFKSFIFWSTVVEHSGYGFSVVDRVFLTKTEAKYYIQEESRPSKKWMPVTNKEEA